MLISTSSTSRVSSSPGRSYLTRGKSTSDESGTVRLRETQSETRETSSGSNNNYLAGSIKRSRDISAATTALSRYRTPERNSTTNGSSLIRSKYSSSRISLLPFIHVPLIHPSIHPSIHPYSIYPSIHISSIYPCSMDPYSINPYPINPYSIYPYSVDPYSIDTSIHP